MPAYDKLQDGEIIDLLGQLDAQLKKIRDERTAMVEHLIERGFAGGTGRFFAGSFVASHMKTSLDRERLEADHGEEFLNPYLKYSTVRATVKVSARKDVAALAAAK